MMSAEPLPENVISYEDILQTNIDRVEALDQMIHDLRDQLRAQLAALKATSTEPMASRIAEAEHRLASGDRPKADDPRLLHKRLAVLGK
jgi:hypothetical protein